MNRDIEISTLVDRKLFIYAFNVINLLNGGKLRGSREVIDTSLKNALKNVLKSRSGGICGLRYTTIRPRVVVPGLGLPVHVGSRGWKVRFVNWEL